MAKVELTPLRTWDDFYPGPERFAKPDVRDLARWNNRVVSNLLYYQTNYLVLAVAVFLIVGWVQEGHLFRCSSLCGTFTFSLVRDIPTNPRVVLLRVGSNQNRRGSLLAGDLKCDVHDWSVVEMSHKEVPVKLKTGRMWGVACCICWW